ncbi:MAG: ABC transporter ATP-binding protein [Deltaproteobacteria bacterium]|nr:ABC transporter ATP-binding protein [Deltaproteobacteria bacterium]
MSKVVLKNIVKKYGDVFAVQKMDLAIDSGSFVSFLGPSGCGKTTTLRMVAGLSDPTDGEINIGEKIVFSHSQKISLPAEKRNMGMVFQSYALWPHMTAFGNVAYPLKIQKKEKEEIETKVQTFLKMVHLEGLEKRYPHELSGGQQQRVALARALIREPEVLLLDEPLSNLDAKLRLSMRQEIKELQRRLKITTIYVTHDQEEAFTLSDVVILMNKGKVERMDSEFAKDFLAQHH